ncbi:MAG: hypothetical protein WBQ95_13720 [Terracidiphilus sp.]
MHGLKILVSTAALLAGLTMAPTAQSQISINIGVQPTCSYGYYGYAPYGCAPRGYYGSGYFYNGVFVGMGPWSGYGYSHGWGGHRFVSDGGGSYHGGVNHVTYHENQDNKESQKGKSNPQHAGGNEKPHPTNSNHGGSNEKPHGDNDHK